MSIKYYKIVISQEKLLYKPITTYIFKNRLSLLFIKMEINSLKHFYSNF